MPKFFFDIDDGKRADVDDVGVEFETVERAREEAIFVLPDIARHTLPDGDRRDFTATVRDETGRSVLRATLSLTAEWLP